MIYCDDISCIYCNKDLKCKNRKVKLEHTGENLLKCNSFKMNTYNEYFKRHKETILDWYDSYG